jgi:hypothetical protein
MFHARRKTVSRKSRVMKEFCLSVVNNTNGNEAIVRLVKRDGETETLPGQHIAIVKRCDCNRLFGGRERMVFLGGPHKAAGRRHILLHAATCAAFLLMGAAALSGCGGDGNPRTDPTPIVTTATVRGRVIEDTTQSNIAGAVIRLGDVTVTTGSDGQFEIRVPGGGDARTLFVDLSGAGAFYSIGSYSGSSCVRLTTNGIPIARESLENGDNTNIGDIKVYSAASDSPPPPPCAF